MSGKKKSGPCAEDTEEMSLVGLLKIIALVMVIAAGLILMAWYAGLSQRQDTVKVKVGSVAATKSPTSTGLNPHSTEDRQEARKHDAEIRSDQAARKAIAEFEERFHTDPSYTPQAYAADLQKISDKTGDYSDISDLMQSKIKGLLRSVGMIIRVSQLANQVRRLEMWLVIIVILFTVILFGLAGLAWIIMKRAFPGIEEWERQLDKKVLALQQSDRSHANYVTRAELNPEWRKLTDYVKKVAGRSGGSQYQGLQSLDKGFDQAGPITEQDVPIREDAGTWDFKEIRIDDLRGIEDMKTRVSDLPERLMNYHDRRQVTEFLDTIIRYLADKDGFERAEELQTVASKTSIFNPSLAAERDLPTLTSVLKDLQGQVLDDLKVNGPPTVDNVGVDDLRKLSRFKRLAEQPQFKEVRDFVQKLIELAGETCDGRADSRDGKRANMLHSLLLIALPGDASPARADQRKFRELCIELQENVKRELVANTRWRIISPSRGEVFDPHKHESQGSEDTDDLSNASVKRIAGCASAGLEYDGKLELPAQVKIFRYRDKG